MSVSDPGNNLRNRNRSNLLHIAYDPSFPNLKVLKKCRSHLAVMGVPGPNGDHFLWPEEAVYLLENCLAVITKKGDIPITFQEGYSILEQKGVSFNKYFTYTTLKKTGFVVIRPRQSRQLSLQKAKNIEENDITSTTEEFIPDEKMTILLKCFPSINCGTLHMPQLHKAPKLVPTECHIEPDPSVLYLSSDSQRQKACRPPYWPSLSFASASETWAEYSERKKQLLEKKKKRNKGTLVKETSSLPIDFEVYHSQFYSYNLDTQPVFRVICLDSREAFSYSKLLPQLVNQSVVFSIFEHGKLAFINSSGASIDITNL